MVDVWLQKQQHVDPPAETELQDGGGFATPPPRPPPPLRWRQMSFFFDAQSNYSFEQQLFSAATPLVAAAAALPLDHESCPACVEDVHHFPHCCSHCDQHLLRRRSIGVAV